MINDFIDWGKAPEWAVCIMVDLDGTPFWCEKYGRAFRGRSSDFKVEHVVWEDLKPIMRPAEVGSDND